MSCGRIECNHRLDFLAAWAKIDGRGAAHNAWLATNQFPDAIFAAAKDGMSLEADVAALKAVRAQALGEGSVLRKAQRTRVTTFKISLHTGSIMILLAQPEAGCKGESPRASTDQCRGSVELGGIADGSAQDS